VQAKAAREPLEPIPVERPVSMEAEASRGWVASLVPGAEEPRAQPGEAPVLAEPVVKAAMAAPVEPEAQVEAGPQVAAAVELRESAVPVEVRVPAEAVQVAAVAATAATAARSTPVPITAAREEPAVQVRAPASAERRSSSTLRQQHRWRRTAR
jgi:hypothetical protein